jgi:hypothetical protein
MKAGSDDTLNKDCGMNINPIWIDLLLPLFSLPVVVVEVT